MFLISSKTFVLLSMLSVFLSLSLSYESRNPEGTHYIIIYKELHKSKVFYTKLIFYLWVVVEALIAIRDALNDPHGVLGNWDEYSVDPCSWSMITCNSNNVVTAL